MMNTKSLIARFLILTIFLTSSICHGAMIQSNVLEINFTDPNEAQKKAIWFPADKLNINSNGLGWDVGPKGSRPGEIQTKPMAVGVSWRPPTAMGIRVTILPPPKPRLLNDGNMSTPYPGNVFVRYSPDLKNWSSWIILEHSYGKSADEKKRNERCYEGSIHVTRRSRNEYFKLLENYSKLDVPWKSDEEAAVQWIIKQQPDWFSKNIPFIGYIEFLFESNFYNGQRIKSFEAEISYCINGRHYPPKDKNIYNKRDSIPWRFKADNKNVDEVNHADDSFETVRKKLIEQIEKDGAKIDNWGKFYNAPFKKGMESKEALAEGSFIYKMFYDKKFHTFTVSQIMEYLRKNSVSQSKRQNILNLLLKNMTLKNPWWMRIKATSILSSFSKKDKVSTQLNDRGCIAPPKNADPDLLLDNDKDGFTKEVELRYGTDPNNIESHPPLVKRLKLIEIKKMLLPVKLMSVNTDGGKKDPADWYIKWNEVVGGKSKNKFKYLNSHIILDKITYTVVKIDLKHEEKQGDVTTVPIDKSKIFLKSIDGRYAITIEVGKPVYSPRIKAVVEDPFNNKKYYVGAGDTIIILMKTNAEKTNKNSSCNCYKRYCEPCICRVHNRKKITYKVIKVDRQKKQLIVKNYKQIIYIIKQGI